MSGKRPSLAENMRAVAEAPVTPEPSPAVRSSKAPPPPVHEEAARTQGKPFYAATRAGKKKATATLSDTAHKQLKTLSVDRSTTVEALLTEAINDLFRKHGKAPIA